MSATRLERSSHEISDVSEVPESLNLVAMALNDSTPDLPTDPIEISILKDENANGNVEVDVGTGSQEKRLASEDWDGTVDVLCDRLKGLTIGSHKISTAESPSSSFEDLSGMPGKIGKDEADVPRRTHHSINPFLKAGTFVECPKCNRKYLFGVLKNHLQVCHGEPLIENS